MSDKKSKHKSYSNEDITIVWQPQLCIHSGICVKGLPAVFKPSDQPWINTIAATTEELKAQVDKCPSGALSYFENTNAAGVEKQIELERVVEIIPNGPLMVYGTINIKSPDGSEELRKNKTAFCRCGASINKPLCDGSHKKIGFEG